MRKKVFFIIPSIAGGGAEKVFVDLVNGIDKTIFDVTLIYLTDEGKAYEVSSTVRVINLEVKRARNAPIKIIKLIRSEKPELIISTLGHLNTMLLMMKKLFPRKTKLIIRQTNIRSLSKNKNKIQQIIQKTLNKFYNNADEIISQSESMKKDFIKLTNVRKNVVTIYNPVDVETILIKAKETVDHDFTSAHKNFFFAGRLNEVKRIPLIIDAFKSYHEKHDQSNLYILGEGPEKEKLEDYIKINNLSDSVKLLGFQKNPYKWLKHADLFIMASKNEGMPNVLLEALALEIPVLIQKHPGGTEEIMKALDIEDRFVEELIITESSFNNYNKDVHSKLLENFGAANIIEKYERTFKEVLNRD